MVGKWDSVHIVSLNSLVISVKGIILTAGQDWGPNLACEKLSSSLQSLPDAVTNQEGLLSIYAFQTVNIVRTAEILKKTNSNKSDM